MEPSYSALISKSDTGLQFCTVKCIEGHSLIGLVGVGEAQMLGECSVAQAREEPMIPIKDH